MKCKNCGIDVFPGQFQCDHCGAIHPTEGQENAKPKTTKESKKSNKEE